MLTDAIQRQFDKAFGILAEAISSFSESQWRSGRSPYDGPARVTVHMLQCAEFYTHRDKSVFTALGKGVWEMAGEELPCQKTTAEWVEKARQMTRGWIDSIGDGGLAEMRQDESGPHSALEAILYAMRHLQHHVGELCVYQKNCGLAPSEWR